MTQVNPVCTHVSASSLASLKACPMRYRLAYREGLRVARDTESQRIGLSWHKMHETYRDFHLAYLDQMAEPLSEAAQKDASDGALTKVIEYLDERYSNLPDWVTPETAELERTILLTSFQGYLWYYQNDTITTLATELKFDLPLLNRIGLPLPTAEVIKVGMIDRIIFWQNMVGNTEYKSTSRTIHGEGGREYWDMYKKNDQISMYAVALRALAKSGLLPATIAALLAEKPELRFGNTLLDVWKRPTIKPAGLSQKDYTVFIESHEYYGQTFEITVTDERQIDTGEVDAKGKAKTQQTATVIIDGANATVEPGSKGFSIRETTQMYAARLLHEITELPEKYFIRREIVRTAAELKAAEIGFFNAYQVGKFMEAEGTWFENGSACKATFKCAFMPICFGPGADSVCDSVTTPVGFKRIFVDLTKEGESLEGEEA